MTDRATQIIATTMTRHPLLGSGCLCGDGPTKYDPAAHDTHLTEAIREALTAADIRLIEPSEQEATNELAARAIAESMRDQGAYFPVAGAKIIAGYLKEAGIGFVKIDADPE